MGGLFGGGGGTISTSEPMIGALRIQTSAYGMAIPILYGRQRVPANMIWYGDFTPIAHTTQQTTGGKGGGGGTTIENTTYTYRAALAMALGEGPVDDIGDVWRGKTQYPAASALADLGLSLFVGSDPQSPWGYLQTYHAGEALSYPGLAYVASGAYDLGASADMENHTFEIFAQLPFGGGIDDANPKDVLVDLLTNIRYGAGFPADQLGDLTAFSNWCVANGMFVSPGYAEQREAQEIVTEMVEAVGCAIVYSEALLKIVPYGDAAVSGNGATYTPDLTPLYDLTDDDFLGDEDPVQTHRRSPADAYNSVQIEFANRANQYNLQPVEAKDQADIEAFGLRPEEPQKLHLFCLQAAAQLAAELRKNRKLYIRNDYEFRLGWRYARLEPMDIVTLTDPGLGLVRAPVRITEIEEDEDGQLLVKAEELPIGVATAATYGSQGASGYGASQNALPGDVTTPLIFEPPLALTGGRNEVWVAVSGGVDWGGCHIWASFDGASYQQVATQYGAARYGVLHSTLAAPGADPDITNTAVVDLNTDGQLLSGSQADVDAFATLCYVGGELLAYKTATLAAARRYNLSYLRRGLYGSVAGSHSATAPFARLDQAIARYTPASVVPGQAIYLKFVSFNAWGKMEQNLADVSAYSYTLQGGLPSGPANLALQSPFIGTSFTAQWSPADGAASYTAEIWSQGVKRRTISTTATAFSYTLEDATADGGPWRDWTLKVATLANGQTSGFSQLNISNPVPAAPAGITTSSTTTSITINWNAVADVDWQDYQVWLDTINGFTPGAGNLKYTGTALTTTITGLTSGTTYYLKVAARDKWGAGTLTYSAQVTKATA